MISACQKKLEITLQEYGIDKNKISEIIESGYYQLNVGYPPKTVPCVADSFYGNKVPSGFIPINVFIKYLNEGNIPQYSEYTKHYTVKSLQEAEEILSSERHKKYNESGRLSFRGQTKEYWLKRKIPNPYAMNHLNDERFIVPSFWRFCNEDHNPANRFNEPLSIFKTFLADRLIYGDISSNTNSENERRYNIHKVEGPHLNEIPLIEQHYGMKTIGLDVTFDLAIAFFFASHQFTKIDTNSKKYTYLPIKEGDHKGVVYCFAFTDPSVYKSDWEIKYLKPFQHIPPLRPMRQSCALPAFHFNEVNIAVRDLDAIFFLDKNFDQTGLPSKEHLFPDSNEDLFYGAVIQEKKRFMDGKINPWDEFVEYEF